MLQYHYTWGNETILGSRIKVIKNYDHNLKILIDYYTVILEPELFVDIDVSKGYLLISKQTIISKDNDISKHITTLKIKAVSNPKPEKIFRIIF